MRRRPTRPANPDLPAGFSLTSEDFDLDADLTSLRAAQVQALLAHAGAHAQQAYGKPICVAVCDAQGFLSGFLRMDDAPLRSIRIARGKAYTCARMGVGTDALLARLRRENLPLDYYCDARLTALPGGAPLLDAQGRLLGGIGVSGLAPTDDQAVADDAARRFTQSDFS